MTFIDPVVKQYLFSDTPLAEKSGKISLAIISIIILIFSFLGWKSILPDAKDLFQVFEWLPFSIAGSILGYLVISFIDRERSVRFFHLLTILIVMLFTGPAAAYFNSLNEATKLFTVGFVEEGVKILPVLLLAIYVPNLIRTKKDGIVYGALAGMGFNIIEIGFYIVSTYLSTGEYGSAAYLHSSRLGLWGFGSHIIWSAFAGLGVGIAMESIHTGWKKWKWAFFCYLLVALAHSLYDLGAMIIALLPLMAYFTLMRGNSLDSIDFGSSDNGSKPGVMNDSMRFMHYAYNLVFIIIMFVQIKRSFNWENQVQVKQLSDEKAGIISEKEMILLENEELFFKRKYRQYSQRVSDKIVLYQNLLALHKNRLVELNKPIKNDPVVSSLRSAIVLLRS